MIQKFEFCNTDFEGAYLIKPFCATDVRGAFIKDYSKEVFEANGLEHNLAEVFYTVSHKGVIRALHFQRVHEQAKLVRCIKGKVFDVIVDLRPDSPTFKKWQGFFIDFLIIKHFIYIINKFSTTVSTWNDRLGLMFCLFLSCCLFAETSQCHVNKFTPSTEISRSVLSVQANTSIKYLYPLMDLCSC